MSTISYRTGQNRPRRPTDAQRQHAAVARIAYLQGELVNGWDVARRLGFAELRLAEMSVWFAVNPNDALNPEYRTIEQETRVILVAARLDFLDLAARIANSWDVVRHDAGGRDLGLELYEATGIDLRIQGRGESIYRRQWRDMLNVNSEPCPF